MMTMTSLPRTLTLLALMGLGATGQERTVVQPKDTSAGLANPGLMEADIKGGLIVHVGCGDGKLTAELRENDRYVVHGLDTSHNSIRQAREHIRSLRLCGKVSVDVFDGKHLPYTDNLVNLLVVDSACDVPWDECRRVLAPLGTAMIRKEGNERLAAKVSDAWDAGEFVIYRKPWPDDISQWTHWLRGPDNNAVAGSRLQETPRHLQWIQDPLWIRHHNLNPGLSALVSSKNRIFYILDEGPPGVEGPDKWTLIARDAFNGVLLWKQPIHQWGWKHWTDQAFNGAAARFKNPHQLMRRLVAVGDTVYVTPGIYSSVHALDAATGELTRKYAGTEKAFEIVCHDGVLVLAVNRTLDQPGVEPDVAVMAVDAESGDILWESKGYKGIAPKVDSLKRYVDSSLAVGGAKVFLVDQDDILGLDLRTGKELWRVKRPAQPADAGRSGQRLPYNYYYPDLCATVYSDNVLYFSQILPAKRNFATKNKKTAVLLAIDIETGKKMWTFDCVTFAHFTPPDIFINRGLVWTLEDQSQSLVGLDPKTGEKRQGFEVGDMLGWSGGHHNCYRNKASERFIFTAKAKGTDYVDLETGEKHLHNWIKGACRYGFMPANGMLYFPSHNCRCYITSKLNGFCALSSDTSHDLQPSDATAVEKGPAYGVVPPASFRLHPSDAWPAYRHDSMRTAQVDTTLPTTLTKKWTSKLGGKLTQSTIAGQQVYVASVDQHHVYCLDRDTGDTLWRYTAGGRVDSPPTYYRGLVVFGSRDGYVYCLDATKGELAWRFRAAPSDMRISAFGQVESAWPAFGSLIVQDDKIYCSAGRSTHLNTGIYLYVLDVNTGLPLRSRCVQPDFESYGEMDGSVMSDILVGDSNQFHIRGVLFDTESLDCVGGRPWTHKQKDRVAGFPFLKAYGGFLDDTWFNASYLIYGDRPNVGHMLVVDTDKETVYGVRGFSKYGAGGSYTEDVARVGETGYVLFANKTSGNHTTVDGPSKRRGKSPSTKKRGRASPLNDWSQPIGLRPLAMIAGRKNLCVVGVEDRSGEQDYWKYLEGRAGGILAVHSRSDGKQSYACVLDSAPVFGGLSAAGAQVFVSCKDGSVICMGAAEQRHQ